MIVVEPTRWQRLVHWLPCKLGFHVLRRWDVDGYLFCLRCPNGAKSRQARAMKIQAQRATEAWQLEEHEANERRADVNRAAFFRGSRR